MTGAQTIIYTAAITLSTMGAISTVAGWVVPQPMIHGAVLAVILGAAVAAWIMLVLWIADTRHAAKVAEQKRRESAADYTRLGRTRG
jgi:tetrahydromethanopterin S-methyltransferase subunit E